jgi:N-dimethylarginine dimethylaminohydrolase
MERARFGGHSMVSPLRKVLVCSPAAAGWGDAARREAWSELGFARPPRLEEASAQHAALVAALAAAGAKVVELPASRELTLDAVYTHDASLVTRHGAILLRPGKLNRRAEPRAHGDLYRELGIPLLGTIEAPGTAEGGDLVWLDGATLLAGRGYRTNREGIAQLRALLAPHRVSVLSAPLPHGPGADACLHLMSLLSVLDERTMIVDLPWLAVETVELLRERGFALVEIDPAERDSLACNVLSLDGHQLLAFAENRSTNARLRAAGFAVSELPGSALGVDGSGGFTCLTRPLRRRTS